MIDLEKEIENIIYEGMFCDINECQSQNINVFDSSSRETKPCNCNGEERRSETVKSISGIVQQAVEEALNTDKVTRVEVIENSERAYVNWKNNNKVRLSFQDDNRTLKIFMNRD